MRSAKSDLKRMRDELARERKKPQAAGDAAAGRAPPPSPSLKPADTKHIGVVPRSAKARASSLRPSWTSRVASSRCVWTSSASPRSSSR